MHFETIIQVRRIAGKREDAGGSWSVCWETTLSLVFGDSKGKCNGFLAKMDPLSEPSEGVAVSAVALRRGLNGLLPSWAMSLLVPGGPLQQTLLTEHLYFCSTVLHFPFRHKTLQVNHCCSWGTVIRERAKKENKNKKIEKKTSQSLYVEFKIVINRACLKKKIKQLLPFFV